MNASQGVRLTLIVLSVVVLIFMLLRTARVIRKMTLGQIIYMFASYLTLWYCIDAAREAYVLGIGWRWRLVAYILAIVLYSFYILMPERLHENMFKGKSWFNHDEDDAQKDIKAIQKYGRGGHRWVGRGSKASEAPRPPKPLDPPTGDRS